MGIDVNCTKRLYQKLMLISPDLANINGFATSKVPDSMVLYLDVLECGQNYRRITLSHYWKHGIDIIPDPSIVLAVFLEWKLAEGLSFETAYSYDEAYQILGEPPVLAVSQRINSFLENWLDTLAKQGHILRVKEVQEP